MTTLSLFHSQTTSSINKIKSDMDISISKISLIAIPIMNAIIALCFLIKRLIFLIFFLLNLVIACITKHVHIPYMNYFIYGILFYMIYNYNVMLYIRYKDFERILWSECRVVFMKIIPSNHSFDY